MFPILITLKFKFQIKTNIKKIFKKITYLEEFSNQNDIEGTVIRANVNYISKVSKVFDFFEPLCIDDRQIFEAETTKMEHHENTFRSRLDESDAGLSSSVYRNGKLERASSRARQRNAAFILGVRTFRYFILRFDVEKL